MLVIGDVLAIVAALVGSAITVWALVMALSMLFVRRVEVAAESVERHPWGAALLGFGLIATVGLVGTTLAAVPMPLVKLMGLTILLVLSVLAMVGIGGLSHLISRRVRAYAPETTPYQALVKGSSLIVMAGFVPFVGWFLVGPVVIMTGLGACAMALVKGVARNPAQSPPAY